MEGDPLLYIEIHSEGVADLLSNGKSHGTDSLPARFLKEVKSEITPALTLIF